MKHYQTYSSTWRALNRYDQRGDETPRPLTAVAAQNLVTRFVQRLKADGDGSSTMGTVLHAGGLNSVLKLINAEIFGVKAYPTPTARAANLFYMLIKNHLFNDGNKRIAAFLTLHYLSAEGVRHTLPPEILTGLTVFVAKSRATDKENVVGLIAECLASYTA